MSCFDRSNIEMRSRVEYSLFSRLQMRLFLLFLLAETSWTAKIRNDILEDNLYCAVGNSTDRLEECPIYAHVDVIPFCVYMHVP